MQKIIQSKNYLILNSFSYISRKNVGFITLHFMDRLSVVRRGRGRIELTSICLQNIINMFFFMNRKQFRIQSCKVLISTCHTM